LCVVADNTWGYFRAQWASPYNTVPESGH